MRTLRLPRLALLATVLLAPSASLAAPIAFFDVSVDITSPLGTAVGIAQAELDDTGVLTFDGSAQSTGGIFVTTQAALIGSFSGGDTLTVPAGGGGSSISLQLTNCTAAPNFCAIAQSVLPVTAPLDTFQPNPIVFDLGIGNDTLIAFQGGLPGIVLDGNVRLTTTAVVPEPGAAGLVLLGVAAVARRARRAT